MSELEFLIATIMRLRLIALKLEMHDCYVELAELQNQIENKREN